jgi:hypothetical protein
MFSVTQLPALEKLNLPVPVKRAVHRLTDTSAAAGVMSRPLLGKLPLRRLIPQDVHSVMDYAGAAMVAGAGLSAARAPEARIAGSILGLAGLGVSLCTDYRLSLKKLIPIEVHEAIDYGWSLAVLAAPFLLGYARRAPVATALQCFDALSTIAASLVTDYRGQRSVHWTRGLATDPGPINA